MKILLLIILSFSCFSRPFFKRGSRVRIKRRLTVFEAMAGCHRSGTVVRHKKKKDGYHYEVRLTGCVITRWFKEARIR